MSEPPSALQASTLPSAISEQPDVLRSSISPGETAPGVESTPLGSITEDKAVIPPTSEASGSGSHPGVAVGTAAGPSASVSDSSIITPRAPTTANTTSDTTTPAAINTVPAAAAAAAPASASASASPAAPHLSEHEPLATELKPITAATLTIRIIKSFEFRTQKSLVLKEVDLEKITVGELMERCRREMKTAPGWKAYRTLEPDTLKLYTVAHGHKTTNLIINLDHDEWILSDLDKTLAEIGAENETELSFFNRQAYEAFKANPEVKWD
ncbi:hypothetical protein EHS25_002004 [Saitozyma podzolica]|uniref:Cytoplasmic protein n=1 Tax=Saitozyma podzolica TaxID=1890683 RepID=A0A427YE71_9TREE|nr:hypothetical protein EHS25_002004 [Saitozyma podzolica]